MESIASLFPPSAPGSTGFRLTWQPRSQLGKWRILLIENLSIDQVSFVCFNDESYQAYLAEMQTVDVEL